MTELNKVSLDKPAHLPQYKTAENAKPLEPTAEEVKLFDFDGNGKVDKFREQTAYGSYLQSKISAQLENKFDINGDGKIDNAEAAAFRAYKKETGFNIDPLDTTVVSTEYLEKIHNKSDNKITCKTPDSEPWISKPQL